MNYYNENDPKAVAWLRELIKEGQEERAARRHKFSFEYTPEEMDKLPMCPHCGHVVCPELGNANHDTHWS